MTERTLYEITGNIADANTLLVNRSEYSAYKVDAECFRLWVHEAWNSPGDICRLLMNCETPADYRAKLIPLIEGQRAAIGKAMG